MLPSRARLASKLLASPTELAAAAPQRRSPTCPMRGAFEPGSARKQVARLADVYAAATTADGAAAARAVTSRHASNSAGTNNPGASVQAV